MKSSTARRQRLIRTIAIATLGVAAAVGIAALVVYVLVPWIRGPEQTPPRPSITASVAGKSVEVKPFEYCEVNRPDICDPAGETVELPVAAGQSLDIALPEAISSAPWILATFYVDPNAPASDPDALQGGEQFFAPGTKSEVSVPDVNEQGLVLAGVEVRLPTGLYNTDTGEDTIVTHATWSVATR